MKMRKIAFFCLIVLFADVHCAVLTSMKTSNVSEKLGILSTTISNNDKPTTNLSRKVESGFVPPASSSVQSQKSEAASLNSTRNAPSAEIGLFVRADPNSHQESVRSTERDQHPGCTDPACVDKGPDFRAPRMLPYGPYVANSPWMGEGNRGVIGNVPLCPPGVCATAGGVVSMTCMPALRKNDTGNYLLEHIRKFVDEGFSTRNFEGVRRKTRRLRGGTPHVEAAVMNGFQFANDHHQGEMNHHFYDNPVYNSSNRHSPYCQSFGGCGDCHCDSDETTDTPNSAVVAIVVSTTSLAFLFCCCLGCSFVDPMSARLLRCSNTDLCRADTREHCRGGVGVALQVFRNTNN